MKQVTHLVIPPLCVIACLVAGIGVASPAAAQDASRPNILIIWGDDIGWYNISAYNLGVMGYQTPNIDRIAHEGALFTDWYGQQSCTAGRAAFIGHHAWRFDRLFVLVPAQAYVANWLQSFADFPPRQKAATRHRPGHREADLWRERQQLSDRGNSRRARPDTARCGVDPGVPGVKGSGAVAADGAPLAKETLDESVDETIAGCGDTSRARRHAGGSGACFGAGCVQAEHRLHHGR
jgi:hypothetical protein